MTTTQLIEKLNAKYGNSEIARLANTGNLEGARDLAVKSGMWGIWEQIGEALGLPYDADARSAKLAEIMKSKFKKT